MKLSARSFMGRGLAAIALVALYGLGTLGVSSFAGVPSAQARGRGRGGGGFRGRVGSWPWNLARRTLCRVRFN